MTPRIITALYFIIISNFCHSQITDSLITPVSIGYSCSAPLQWTSLKKDGLVIRGGTASANGVHIHCKYDIIHYDTLLREVFHQTFKLPFESYEQPTCWTDKSHLYLLFPFSRRPVSTLIIYDFVNKTTQQYNFKNKWFRNKYEMPDQIFGASAGDKLYFIYIDAGKAFIDIFSPATINSIEHREIPNQKEIITGNNNFLNHREIHVLRSNCDDSIFFVITEKLFSYEGAKLYGISNSDFFINSKDISAKPFNWPPIVLSYSNKLLIYDITLIPYINNSDTTFGYGIERGEIKQSEKTKFEAFPYFQWDSLPERKLWNKISIWGMLTYDLLAELDPGEAFYFSGANMGSGKYSFLFDSDDSVTQLIYFKCGFWKANELKSFDARSISSKGTYCFRPGKDESGNTIGYCIGNRGINFSKIDSSGHLIENITFSTALQQWDINRLPPTYFAGGKPPEYFIPIVDSGYFYANNGIIVGTKSQGKNMQQLLCIYKFAL